MSELLVTKNAKGEYRWLLISSSAYVDRDGEIVTEKALAQAVDLMHQTKEFGDLRWWHTDIVLGKADWAALHAHQLIESGTFANKTIAEGIAKSANGLGASIGFKHPPTQPINKEYHDIHIKERSLLPRGKESNLYTNLRVTGGTMEKERLDGLIERIGSDEAYALLSQVEAKAKEADAGGVTRKATKGWWARLKEAAGAIPDPEETEGGDNDEDTDELETVVVGTESEKKEAKADDDDTDDAPLTMGKARAMIAAAIAAAKADWDKARTKETDALATLATKEEVAQVAAAVTPVVTIQKETVERLGQVEKQVQTLTGENLPRGMAGIFRGSTAGSTATEKAAKTAETLKARQGNGDKIEELFTGMGI